MKDHREIIDQLERERTLPDADFTALLTDLSPEDGEYLYERAREVRHRVYGRDVYLRGLIEFTNYCKNDCYYCGIRKSNCNAQRYRLTDEQILDCCEQGHALGFRTFVLQGGEDPYFTTDRMVSIIRQIKDAYPDCALTLSIGERSRADYAAFRQAGADRYLLRHETANAAHYRILHPEPLSLSNRIACLESLKELGFQTGCGFMVGSPGQTVETLAEDLLLIRRLNPQMVGIGPFIPHGDTPFHDQPTGGLELTLFLLSLIRIQQKQVLLPATTALGTIDPKGRELGILAGANVVMPNLSPVMVRKKYSLYDNKICTGEESAQCRSCLQKRMESIGYTLVTARGDYPA